jgi:hypothetical protein
MTRYVAKIDRYLSFGSGKPLEVVYFADQEAPRIKKAVDLCEVCGETCWRVDAIHGCACGSVEDPT